MPIPRLIGKPVLDVRRFTHSKSCGRVMRAHPIAWNGHLPSCGNATKRASEEIGSGAVIHLMMPPTLLVDAGGICCGFHNPQPTLPHGMHALPQFSNSCSRCLMDAGRRPYLPQLVPTCCAVGPSPRLRHGIGGGGPCDRLNCRGCTPTRGANKAAHSTHTHTQCPAAIALWL